jgi:hypothetical protein
MFTSFHRPECGDSNMRHAAREVVSPKPAIGVFAPRVIQGANWVQLTGCR